MGSKDHQKLSVTEIGYHANRSCTDIWAAVLLVIFWIFMMILAGVAFKDGHLKAFVYGADYMGNICGEGDVPSNVNLNQQQWFAAKYLWYPIAWSDNGFTLASALKLGICVPACPTRGATVNTYSFPSTTGHDISAQYTSLFNTSDTLGRCIPNFASFHCGTASDCAKKLSNLPSQDHFNSVLGIGGFLTSGVEQLKEKMGVVAGLSVLCIILSFGWLFLLRVIVKPLVGLTCIALFLAGVLGGAVMLHFSRESVSGSSTAHWWMAGAIIAWIVTFLYLCLLIFLRKDLVSACDIIEESSKVPVQMPKIVIVPVVCSVFILLFAVFMGFIAIAIHTSGDFVSQKVENPSQSGTHVSAEVFVARNWRTIGQLYNLFMFLWTMGFLHAIGHLTIALCAVLWYWSTPGEHKQPMSNSLSWSFLTTMKYHLGTVALGSFLIAVVQFLRAVMNIFEKRLRVISEGNAAAKVLLCCANCCLSCFERVVALLTKNAYVMTAMTGEGLFPAARQALGLLLSNRAAIAVNVLGEIILVIGKILITALVVFISWAAVYNDGVQSNLMFCIVMGLTAYFISSVFATVFSVCIDGVLLSYCVDKEENNGADRPYYFPEALSRHVEDAHRRSNKSAAGMPSSSMDMNEQGGGASSGYGHI